MSSGDTAASPPHRRRASPPRPDSVDVDETFDIKSLHMLRQTVAAHAGRLGAQNDQVERLIIVAGELATNAIRHGGGRGRLLLWHHDDALYCQVSDQGPGITDPTAGTSPPNPLAGESGGRGLWICRNLASELTISTGPDGRGAIVQAVIPP
ncbi:MAG TPA: ATP-binding protein [Jiangellaceae bacterium]|nr:ATP-binding protein [Jiangellaceae bacterium]